MSRMFALAVAAALSGIAACDRGNEDVPKVTRPVAPRVAGASAPQSAGEKAAVAARSDFLTREQALALATRGDCLICHRIEYRLVGPAWKDVAAKYRGDANAESTIASHIRSGGSFGWKFGVMPPRGGGDISDDEVASMARFIAALK